jgi:hypothetical protein
VGTRRARHLVCLAIAGLGCAVAAFPARADTRISLKPEDRAGWSPTQIFGAMRPDYHSDRLLRIESSPPGASLDLFYVRASFQKRYAQASAPVVVELPTRAEAGKRDSVTIRAFLPGHKIETVHVPVRGDQDEVMIELAPLDNALTAVAHTYFAGRAGLSLLLKEPASIRLQKAEKGFSVILAQTFGEPAATALLEHLKSPLVAGAQSQQLGEDLLVKVQLAPQLTDGNYELRSREQAEDARGLYRLTLDLIPNGQQSDGIGRARAALGQIGSGDVAGCAATFDSALRSKLDREQLARALAPRGDFTDPYLRAALRRLGEVSPGGMIRLEDGAAFRPGVPLELAAAASQASSARGYLALLRQWVRLLEPDGYRNEALRSLVAPEMEPASFRRTLAAAEAAEQRCRGTASLPPASDPAS